MGAIGFILPSKISGLSGWWDASDYKDLALGTAVSTWVDKTGNNNLTKSGSGAGLTALDPGGFPCITTGNNSNYYRKTGITTFTGAVGFTIFSVFSRPTYAGTTADAQFSHELLYDGTNDASVGQIQSNTNMGVRIKTYGHGKAGNGSYTVDKRIIVMSKAPTSGNNTYSYDNHYTPREILSAVACSAFTNSCSLTIAKGENPGGTLGYHFETIIYNRQLTEAEFNDVLYYLRTKYNAI